jgi:hypothetical protein
VNRCKDCKHWEIDKSAFHLCGICCREGCPGAPMETVSGDGYNSGFLYTKPEFGCVEWQAKD